MGRLVRTRAERRVDELSAEARRLRHTSNPTVTERSRLAAISAIELPKAWRAVNQAREAERRRRH